MEKASIGRKNVRFLDPSEDADFTSRVLVITTAHPCPHWWPTMHTVIAEKRMFTQQHDPRTFFPWKSSLLTITVEKRCQNRCARFPTMTRFESAFPGRG